ncbi:MAG: Uncharacterized hydrolase DSY2054, partial [uncultured Gemmatimonadaceae bacterium]
ERADRRRAAGRAARLRRRDRPAQGRAAADHALRRLPAGEQRRALVAPRRDGRGARRARRPGGGRRARRAHAARARRGGDRRRRHVRVRRERQLRARGARACGGGAAVRSSPGRPGGGAARVVGGVRGRSERGRALRRRARPAPAAAQQRPGGGWELARARHHSGPGRRPHAPDRGGSPRPLACGRRDHRPELRLRAHPSRRGAGRGWL